MIEIKKLDASIALHNPRRIMKYVLFYCSSGEITIVVDEKELILKKEHIITITSGQYHYIKKATDPSGYILEFTLDFFCKNDSDIELIFHNGLFCHFSMNEVIPVDKKIVETQLNAIEEELMNEPYQYLISVHSRIELVLVAINRSKVNRGDEIWKPEALFLKFLEAVRDNMHKNYSVSDYAIKLGTTEARLNELAKQHAGKTAQNVIYGLITSEAKRLLTYENLTVKEVAYKLGFNDPFYFSNFFKKHTRLSPSLFQKRFAQ